MHTRSRLKTWLKRRLLARRISLRRLFLLLLLVLGIGPLIIVSFFNLRTVQGYLATIEEDYEHYLLQSKLLPLEHRIDTYTELIGFVSQLPAVLEILEQGNARVGGLAKEQATIRYTKVMTQAFHKFPDIIRTRVLTPAGEERLLVERAPDQVFHVKGRVPTPGNGHGTRACFHQVLRLRPGEVIVVPQVIRSSGTKAENGVRLLLQLGTPIRFQEATVGVYISEVDVGVLSLSFPEVQWVFSDGRYLTRQAGNALAFHQFPTLKRLFASGKPGICGNDPRTVWRPLYRGVQSELVLWAGQQVDRQAAQITRHRAYWRILTASLLIGGFVFFMTYLMSHQVEWFFARLLSALQKAMLEHQPRSRVERSRITEVDSFLVQLEKLTQAHAQVEQERASALEALRHNEQMLLAMADAVQNAVLLLDEHNTIHLVNASASRMFGYSQEEMLGQQAHYLFVPERFKTQAAADFSQFIQTGEGRHSEHPFEFLARGKDGAEFPVEIYLGRFRRNDRWWVVGAISDISERKEKERALIHLAETDPLTGVNNRRKLVVLAEQELKRCRRYELSLYFLMFDLDHFKRVNDSYGHAVGDEVLRYFAALCSRLLRNADLFGRMGGEEFAAVLSGLSQEEAVGVAERIRRSFTQVQTEKEGQLITVATGVSIGVARLRPQEDSVETGLKKADQALYQAKERGRNQVVFSG